MNEIQMTADELAALGLEAGAAPEEPEESESQDRYRFACEVCGKRYTDRTTLRRHVKREHAPSEGGTVRGGKTVTIAPDVEDAEAIVQEAVGHAQATGAMLYAGGLRYVGVAIAGAEDDQRREVVRSRAKTAGEILLPIAKRNVRVLGALARFNQLFHGGALFDVVGSVAAAGVMDAASIGAALQGADPREAAKMVATAGVKLGPMTLQPIPMVIPDVLAFVAQKDAEEAEAAAAAGHQAGGSPNGHAPAEKRSRRRRAEAGGTEVIEGGVTGT